MPRSGNSEPSRKCQARRSPLRQAQSLPRTRSGGAAFDRLRARPSTGSGRGLRQAQSLPRTRSGGERELQPRWIRHRTCRTGHSARLRLDRGRRTKPGERRAPDASGASGLQRQPCPALRTVGCALDWGPGGRWTPLFWAGAALFAAVGSIPRRIARGRDGAGNLPIGAWSASAVVARFAVNRLWRPRAEFGDVPPFVISVQARTAQETA